MINDPIALIAVTIMVFTHVKMAIMARDDSRTKGIEAFLFLCCPPFALFYYMRMPRRKRTRIDYLHWVFIASAAVVIYKVT